MSDLNFTGNINYYVLFDLGHEIDLNQAATKLSELIGKKPFQFRRPSKSVLIGETPLVIPLGTTCFDSSQTEEIWTVTGKIWNYGALSLNFCLEIDQPLPFKQLTFIAQRMETSKSISEGIIDIANKLVSDLSTSVKNPAISKPMEDYLLFNYRPQNYKNSGLFLQQALKDDGFYQLMLTDPNLEASEQIKTALQSQVVKYSQNDFVIIDWNSAFICSEGDWADIADVIEFAVCQLLELRYYDELLTKKLTHLYRSIQSPPSSLYNSPYKGFAKEAALIYIEMAEIIEKVENAFNVVGDFYYARVYRLAIERFRIKDWQQSVDTKLKNLADLAMLFQTEVNAQRTHLIELTIVILIAIEVVPLIANAIKSWIL
jgi:hypothetical protein